ncbi:DUF4445 domain-containing protein [Desulfovibrionales bacterium]
MCYGTKKAEFVRGGMRRAADGTDIRSDAQICVRDATGHEECLPLGPGRTLAEVIYVSGRFPSPALCAGLGLCGVCRIRFLSVAPESTSVEARVLSVDALADGWRLGCRHLAQPGSVVELPLSISATCPPAQAIAPFGGLGWLEMAVDLGTTTIEWDAMDCGCVVASGRELNPQLGAGVEVMSRLAYAGTPEGAIRLQRLVVDRLAALATGLAGTDGGIIRACVTGNSVMLALLCGRTIKSLAGLARAPYHLDWQGGIEVSLGPSLPVVYIPPLIAPFVGADLSAGLAALLWSGEVGSGEIIKGPPSFPFVLADLGTNGEFLLALSPQRVLAASVPMGPALEGIGFSMGTVAGPRAVVGFDLGAMGLVPIILSTEACGLSGFAGETIPLIGRALVLGLTGTAYLSLAATLLRLGLLGRDGRFIPFGTTLVSPFLTRLAAFVSVGAGGEPCFVLPNLSVIGRVDTITEKQVVFSASDVESLLKVKAVFNLALSCLTRRAGLTIGDLAAVYLAGALGSHVVVADLETLGFLPVGLGVRVRKIGNTSLAGARLLLRQPELRPHIEALAGGVELVDLCGMNCFAQLYFSKMVFEYVP